ncbi:phosphatase PAP2 family protein [Aliiglaciecola sp. LCG003]|uniref:phosphatase PAP2 family protein n=1 Tax=Aliiglaciecola sp. LCG003 TaxID=3053655 RepID=UPI0025729DDA|nr:phosphatase PAP2 family protein [Aliiglaciecola sp. LCG003]WJG11023.1 phosphatase PAP2 family protein [Aliiglaciecola sp. LCG003]
MAIFVELAGVVLHGGTAALDEKILLSFRIVTDVGDPIGPKWVEEMMRDITALGGVGMLVFMTFIVLVYLLMEKYNKAALLLFVAIASGMAVSFTLKYGITRPRPDLVPHGSYVYTSSFPSGHAMMSALVYFTIAGLLSHIKLRKRVKSYFFFVATLLTISIGISRIYLGVHWPTDVLAGWLLGVGWAILTLFVLRYLKYRGWIGPQSEDK